MLNNHRILFSTFLFCITIDKMNHEKVQKYNNKITTLVNSIVGGNRPRNDWRNELQVR